MGPTPMMDLAPNHCHGSPSKRVTTRLQGERSPTPARRVGVVGGIATAEPGAAGLGRPGKSHGYAKWKKPQLPAPEAAKDLRFLVVKSMNTSEK